MKYLYKKISIIILINLITITAIAQNNNAFRFKIMGNNYTDETVIRLVNGATTSFDGNYDAWKLFSPNPNVPSIYTQISAGQELSINSLPEFSEDVSITIYTNIPANGVYTLNIEEVFALTPNYKISLTDLSATTHYRILGDTALVFTFNTQQNSPSFTFNISTPIVTNTTNETCFNMNNGAILVNNAGNTDWNTLIEDVNANIIVNNSSNSSINNYGNLLPGIYTAKISSKGIIDDFNFTIDSAVNLTADFNLNKDTVYISEGGDVTILNNSQNAQNYTWNFGDGGSSFDINPIYVYSSLGNFDITLSASNTNCVSERVKQITVLQFPSIITSINSIYSEKPQVINLGNGNYRIVSNNLSKKQLLLYDINGRIVYEKLFFDKNFNLSLANNSAGIYILKVFTKKGKVFQEKIYR
jgi:hypothetical protein